MKTSFPGEPAARPNLRRRFRLRHPAVVPAAPPATPRPSYWEQARGPWPSLVFITPIIMAYELGLQSAGGPDADALRTGADAWLRQALAAVGLGGRWLPALGLLGILLAWQVLGRRAWRFAPGCLPAMAVESLVLAVGLIGLGRLVDLGFARLEGGGPLAAAGGPAAAALIGFLGAGVYEEALFRLALIPAGFAGLRLLQAPRVLAATLAVSGSALLFSMAHHAGAPGEPFTWFAFIFRWLAGVYFAWVFVLRGFGVAVGTHAAYDILVGWLGWHL